MSWSSPPIAARRGSSSAISSGLLDAVPMLAALIERRTAEALHLSNRITIEVHTATLRSRPGLHRRRRDPRRDRLLAQRGLAPTPTSRSSTRIRPAMATVPEPLCSSASRQPLRAARRPLGGLQGTTTGRTATPCSSGSADHRDEPDPRRGRDHRRLRRTTRPARRPSTAPSSAPTSRPSSPARSSTPASIPGPPRVAPRPGDRVPRVHRPRGRQSGSDSFTLAIAHAEARQGRRIAVLDAIREVASAVLARRRRVREFAALLRTLRDRRSVGDAYAGDWPARGRSASTASPTGRRASRSRDLPRRAAVASTRHASSCSITPASSRSWVPWSAGRVAAGATRIDHAPHGHDDVANASAACSPTCSSMRPGATGGAVPMFGDGVRSISRLESGAPGTESTTRAGSTGARWMPKIAGPARATASRDSTPERAPRRAIDRPRGRSLTAAQASRLGPVRRRVRRSLAPPEGMEAGVRADAASARRRAIRARPVVRDRARSPLRDPLRLAHAAWRDANPADSRKGSAHDADFCWRRTTPGARWMSRPRASASWSRRASWSPPRRPRAGSICSSAASVEALRCCARRGDEARRPGGAAGSTRPRPASNGGA